MNNTQLFESLHSLLKENDNLHLQLIEMRSKLINQHETIKNLIHDLANSQDITFMTKQISNFQTDYEANCNNDLNDIGEWEVDQTIDGYNVKFDFQPWKLNQIIEAHIEEFTIQLLGHLQQTNKD